MFRCKYCSKEFETKSKLGGHIIHCKENPKYDELYNKVNNIKYSNISQSYYNNFNKCNCKFCNKEYDSINKLKQHEIRCKENPNKLGYNISNFNNKGRVAWNKGLDITDERVKKYGNTNSERIKLGINKIWCEGLTEETDERVKRYVEKIRNNPNTGGIREHSGIGKSGWYKGIYCDSSWELAYLIYCLEHNIKIERFKKSFKYIGIDNKEHKYYPDFLINDNEIIEIKGYISEKWKCKECIIKNENIKVLYYDDLKDILNYVKEKYGDDFIKLYEL